MSFSAPKHKHSRLQDLRRMEKLEILKDLMQDDDDDDDDDGKLNNCHQMKSFQPSEIWWTVVQVH